MTSCSDGCCLISEGENFDYTSALDSGTGSDNRARRRSSRPRRREEGRTQSGFVCRCTREGVQLLRRQVGSRRRRGDCRRVGRSQVHDERGEHSLWYSFLNVADHEKTIHDRRSGTKRYSKRPMTDADRSTYSFPDPMFGEFGHFWTRISLRTKGSAQSTRGFPGLTASLRHSRASPGHLDKCGTALPFESGSPGQAR